jgi:hypothetical protein
MTVNLKRPAFVWALLLCIVLVNGFMAAPSVGHAEHHAHHQAGTHSTGICAWLCAAGEEIESSEVQFASSLQLIEHVFLLPSSAVPSVVLFSYFFRGPPSLLS